VIALAILLGVVAWAARNHALKKTHWGSCAGNTQMLSRAMELYLDDSDGVFPPAERWRQALSGIVGERDLSCPAVGSGGGYYAFNSALGGVRRSGIRDPHEDVVCIFESGAAQHRAGGPELLPEEPPHRHGDRYCFVDGHCATIARKKNPDGTWANAPDADVIWDTKGRE
jgi:hypothetical protein